MILLHHHQVHVHVHFRNRNPCRSVSVSVLRRKSDSVAVAARDRVIDFGKYKGKMLGSLPSSYLKWVSNNLRAGHFEEWANLADQVLTDAIYRDRIEWEFALNVLTGNSNSSSSSSSPTPTPTAVLEEISERFGWNNLDKVGWSQVDFDLLGTSKGARIPRLVNVLDTQPKPKHQHQHQLLSGSGSGSAQWGRRMERRERQKMRLRSTQAQQHKNNNINIIDGKDEIDGHKHNHNHNADDIANPFPGRQALLRCATGTERPSRKPPHKNNICF